jgi:hypothetical protein
VRLAWAPALACILVTLALVALLALGTGALVANVANNLPACLVLEPVAADAAPLVPAGAVLAVLAVAAGAGALSITA